MANPIVVVFENAPEEQLPAWMQQVISELQLTLIDTEKVHAEVIKDPKGREAVKKSPSYSELHVLAPFYGSALEKIAAGESRLAVRGSQWLKQLPKVDGFVFDRGPVEAAKKQDMAKARAPFTPEKIAQLYAVGLQAIEDMAKATLKPERILELPVGTPEPEKKSKTSAFLSKLG